MEFFPIIKWLVCLMEERVARRVALLSIIKNDSLYLFEYKSGFLSSLYKGY